jgi:hypothetical protein
MILSLREARMVLERLVLVTGIDAGLVPSLRDCALYSAALGLGGFEQVEANLRALRHGNPGDLELVETDAGLELRGHGLHAWFAVDPLADLLAETMNGDEDAEVLVTGFTHPAELRCAEAAGQRLGLIVSVAVTGDDARVTARRVPSNGPDVIMDIVRNGLPVDAGQWWRLFEHSEKALAPDSFESRRHAGAIIVEADGRVIGRQDEDDTDLNMLVGADAVAVARAKLNGQGPA